MRLSDIRENASAGSTTAANMGTTISGGTPPKGQFFGGDPASSIYPVIKKHRKARKEKVHEAIESKYWIVMKELFKQFSNSVHDDQEGRKFIHDKSMEAGCSNMEAWETVEAFFKRLGKWGPTMFSIKEATKTAKPPEKPSGKSEIIGSTKPYREPKVLGPTAKVKSVGKILGGKPKKNPTLSTKFFGTCSANNDPGNKLIIAELTYREFKNATKAIAKVCPNCGNSFKNVHDIKQQFCSKDCENEGQVSLKLKEAWERPIQTEFIAKDGGKVVGLEDISRLVKRVMDDSHGQMGRLQACLFVSGMFKNCTGWTILFALEDYAKMKATEMYGNK